MRKEATALSRAKVLRPILEIEEQGFPVSCALEDAAHDLGLSKSHTWRLYRRMKANDARSSALDLQRRGPKKGTRRLSGEVEQIIECSLRQYFLVRERPSFLRVVGEIRAECVAKGFTPPARETIKARLDAMDQREVLRKRTGAKAAAKVFAARPGHLNVEHPLEVVQIDHTPADIILVDHVERLPLNRPFLTLAIDVATRIILGAYVSFDPPSVLSVALCLDHCVRPKSVQVPNALEELAWPTSGIPKAIFVDNGQEFHSAAFKLACEEWGIGIEYRPAGGGAHYGGHIERLIGTTMGAVHVLPGTTQSSTLEKGDYDSSKHAALTLSEFEDWLHLEICRYHNSTHSALGRTPLAAWADLGGDDAGRRVVDTEAFRISFMPLERRRLGRAGITLFSVGYWSDAFAQMIGRIKGKVVVKYDPRDLYHRAECLTHVGDSQAVRSLTQCGEPMRFAMAAPIDLRNDFDSVSLRRLAKRTRDATQSRRLLALAEVYDGGSRTDASRIGGVGLQIIRDWVLRFNARGPDGLVDGKSPGAPSKLNADHRRALAEVVEAGPVPAVDGVVRWRRKDLARWLLETFAISLDETTVGRELKALGFAKISARPRHYAQNELAVEALKKTSPPNWRRSGRGSRKASR